MKIKTKWAIEPLAFIATLATIICAAITIMVLFPFIVYQVIKNRKKLKNGGKNGKEKKDTSPNRTEK